jgi:two-component system, LytTR family, sensor kinase
MEWETPETGSARVPLKTVLASITGLWLCYFVLTTLRSEVLGFGFPLEMMWRRALACLAGIAITAMLWLILRLFDARPLWAKIIAALLVSVPAAVLLVQSNALVFADIEQKAAQNMAAGQTSLTGDPLASDGMPGDDADTPPNVVVQQVPLSPVQTLMEEAFGRYFMMLTWCALYFALLTGEKARAAEKREGTYKRAAKAAELRSLRYQVNPHFLFNTLNSISALVLTGKTQAAERMIQTISTFYRRSLADDPTADVPLREEFALQKLYLDIEAVRFPHRLRAVYKLPPELEDAKVPGLILQPLVENSVKHAVAPTSEQVTITIAAREEYGRLVVTVSDDGPGPAAPDAEKRGYGIGVANVQDRLEARFGGDATIVSGPVPGGYSTQLRMPILHQADLA